MLTSAAPHQRGLTHADLARNVHREGYLPSNYEHQGRAYHGYAQVTGLDQKIIVRAVRPSNFGARLEKIEAIFNPRRDRGRKLG